MTADSGASVKRKSLEELFAGLDTDDADSVFLEQILAMAASRDPELPDLLSAGAIPRTLDAAVVGVLRDSPSDIEGNGRLLGLLADFRFVLPHPAGGFTYHDNTRDAFLADWRSSDEKRARFTELNLALAAFYEARFVECLESDRSLSKVSELIARANPDRLRRLTSVIDGRMAGSLLEALHHQLMADTREGFDFFKTTFHRLEDAGRLSLCHSLISFTRDFLRRQSPADSEPAMLAWLQYFDARAARGLLEEDLAGAESVLVRLLDREELPADLRCWALSDLAQVYETQARMDLALRTSVELSRQPSEADVYNAPLRHSRLGVLHAWLGDPAAAKREFELAIDVVEERPGTRADIGVFARLDLSAALAQLGDWPGAFDAAIEALYRARTSFAADRPIQGQVAKALSQLLSRFDALSSDCAAAEGIDLLGTTADLTLQEQLGFVDLLLDSGRVRTARARADRLLADLDTASRSPEVRLRLDFQLSITSLREGREADAVEGLSHCVDRGLNRQGTHVLGLVALSNRGLCRRNLADTASAIADLEAAQAEWVRCGSVIDAASVTLALAGVYVRTGQVTKAEAFLERAEADLPAGSPHLTRLLMTKGDLCRFRGDWPGAQNHYEHALTAAVETRQLTTEAEVSRDLATVHAKRSQWQLSSEYERRAGAATARLAAADAVTTTDQERESERENINGVRTLNGAVDRTSALDRARQHFCRAVELEPQGFWPQLNLSFTYAEQEDWLGATEALCRVFELCPAMMRTARLCQCLNNYVLDYVRQLENAGRAHMVVGEALARLSGAQPDAELAHLHAVHGLALALADRSTTARDAFTAAFSVADPARPVVDALASVLDADGYWIVDGLLDQLQADDALPQAVRDRVATAREKLTPRLDLLFGLNKRDDDASELPIVTPTRVEIGDGLVPFVDSRQDGGVFLFELIPAMRERVRASTGVTVPGVRMRGDPSLPPGGFCIQVDEVPVHTGSVALRQGYVVTPLGVGPLAAGSHVVNFHPLTGQQGMWIVDELDDGEPLAAAHLSPPQYLIHRIECVLRTHVARYLGPQEVDVLVDGWADEADGHLVATVLPDPTARLRLTWVLQALVEDGLPITDWRDILTTIRDEGGIEVRPRALARAVRIRLRAGLPGRQPGRAFVHVPAHHERALLDQHQEGTPWLSRSARHEFARWLRETVVETGPALCLVVETQQAVEVIGAIARADDPLICTLSRTEMDTP